MPKVTLRDKAYESIKKNIVTCHYPPGSFLTESDLGEDFGVSRTPIREALTRLEQENLVRIFSKKGIQVTDITLNDISEVYQVRMLLEPHIILRNASELDTNQLVRIRNTLLYDVENSDEEWQYQLDSDLHHVLISSNHNQYFQQTLANVYDQNQRLRIMSGKRVQARLERTHKEHIQIIDEILLGNYEKAAQAMEDHLNASREAAIRSMLK